MGWLMAIDPGTRRMGVALFDGLELAGSRLLLAGGRELAEVRIAQLMAQLEDLARRHPEIREVACESPGGMDARRPAPELLVLVRRIRRWAAGKPRRWTWTAHHPSSIRAAVRPQGAGAGITAKEVIRLGVKMLYGEQIDVDGTDQNVVDAVAVGHCHLVQAEAQRREGKHR